mmetsp:Transcript_29809/g.80661  ORF Transcript_29809/g.80661 Transcript_29809/m.80661 type:complete len:205 (+) Transcript_29809:2103-2717(+)
MFKVTNALVDHWDGCLHLRGRLRTRQRRRAQPQLQAAREGHGAVQLPPLTLGKVVVVALHRHMEVGRQLGEPGTLPRVHLPVAPRAVILVSTIENLVRKGSLLQQVLQSDRWQRGGLCLPLCLSRRRLPRCLRRLLALCLLHRARAAAGNRRRKPGTQLVEVLSTLKGVSRILHASEHLRDLALKEGGDKVATSRFLPLTHFPL